MLHTPATTLEANHCQKGKQTYSHWLTLEQRNNLGDDVMHHSTLPLQALCPLPSATHRHLCVVSVRLQGCHDAPCAYSGTCVTSSQMVYVYMYSKSTCAARVHVLQVYISCRSTCVVRLHVL